MALPSADPNQLSPSQRARLERLRQPTASPAASTRLADRINAALDDVDRVQNAAFTAQEDEAMAWLVLCDRGWPRDVNVDGLDMEQPYEWIAAWSEMTSLPMEIATPKDRTKLRWIETRLQACESRMRSILPAALWEIVGPLDPTGRATLSYVLRSLVTLTDARFHYAAAITRRDELLERFTLFRHESRRLGVRAPLAAFDVRAWRAAAAAIRVIED